MHGGTWYFNRHPTHRNADALSALGNMQFIKGALHSEMPYPMRLPGRIAERPHGGRCSEIHKCLGRAHRAAFHTQIPMPPASLSGTARKDSLGSGASFAIARGCNCGLGHFDINGYFRLYFESSDQERVENTTPLPSTEVLPMHTVAPQSHEIEESTEYRPKPGAKVKYIHPPS